MTYFIFRTFVMLLRWMPYRLVYLLSDFVRLILCHVIGYRRKVIQENVDRSFPELGASEKNKIEKKFYQNLSDILIEAIKGFSLSEKELNARYKLLNPELLDHYYDEGKNIICVGAHYANWEWGIMAAPLQMKHQMMAIFTPLTNTAINDYTVNNRSRYGTKMVRRSDAGKMLKEEYNEPVAILFGGDQSPARLTNVHWMQMLNQETAVLTGAEQFAKELDCPVIYFDVQRLRRGYYTVEVSVLFEKPCETGEGEITEAYMRKLEEIIRSKPSDFLWSHRRWKHSRQAA